MIFTDSVALVRTRKQNTVGVHMISTYRYQKLMPSQFVYSGYVGESFEITENVGGMVIITITNKLPHSGITFKNVIRFDNVTDIEIMSEHDI